MVEERRAMVARYLCDVRTRLETAGVTVSSEMAIGKISDTILSTATRRSVGVIAMATHGRVGPERWFIGSVTDRVVRAATAPVLLVRPQSETKPVSEPSLSRIILPLDGSLLAETAIPHATFLAQSFNLPVVLIQALDLTWLLSGGDSTLNEFSIPPELEDELSADAVDYLKQTGARFREVGITVEERFSFGRPGDIIAEQAHATPGALIVMSTHGRSGLGRTVLGSTADRVVRAAEAPVLLVRGVAQDSASA